MSANEHENKKEVSDMVLCGDILFVLFREGSIRGVDMKRYMDIPRDGILLMTPEELYDSGTAVFCMLWDEDWIYVSYDSRAHEVLNFLYHESMLAECRRLWY